MKKVKKSLIIIVSILLAIILAILGYVFYVLASYYRIEDNLDLSVKNGVEGEKILPNTTYSIVTQNIGFGAYTNDFTFFMDGGKESWAKSPESVIKSVNSATNKIKSYNPDIILFQEVDTDSTRSYHINQKEMLEKGFKNFDSVFGVNYHSSFLFWPLYKPHGASNSGIISLSKFDITSSKRVSFPISTGFSKFLDLDRCFTVAKIPVQNGKELVVYNVHSSAYGGSDEIRTAQMTKLFGDMEREYNKGNYVICGGDFNHDFTKTSVKDLNDEVKEEYGWAQAFPDPLIPKGFKKCINYKDGKLLPSCRNADIPYSEKSFVLIVDGFIVSQNVKEIETENIDIGFEYSDHSPVLLKFALQ